MFGAIIVAGVPSVESISTDGVGADGLNNDGQTPFACMTLLGQSVVSRLADDWKQKGASAISVFAPQRGLSPKLTDLWRRAGQRLSEYEQQGIKSVVVAQADAYAEIDIEVMLGVHEESGETVTRAVSDDGPLHFWFLDPKRFSERDNLFEGLNTSRTVNFEVRGYVNRLETPRDVRSLVTESLSHRCHFRPQGYEIKPGVWMGGGAQVERSARVVAPAFIGRGVRIADECLITRGSNIESDSRVDFGTAVEDSSILSCSYVGIGLDLSHSLVDGDSLFNLRHNVKLRISDPFVMRRNNVNGSNNQPPSDFETGEMILSSTEELAK